MTLAERAKKAQEERVESMMAPPELKPMTAVIPMLKMNNQPPKVLYETVGKLAGINVVFDSQYHGAGAEFQRGSEQLPPPIRRSIIWRR